MLALYLLAAHMVGDFVFQDRWQAAGKLDNERLRARHVAAYAVPFVPIAVARSGTGHHGVIPLEGGADVWLMPFLFLGWLIILHFATDSHRFRSTLGDVIEWRLNPGLRKVRVIDKADLFSVDEHGGAAFSVKESHDEEFPLPPNPWPATSIMVDQTLHVVQLAMLGGLFLS